MKVQMMTVNLRQSATEVMCSEQTNQGPPTPNIWLTSTQPAGHMPQVLGENFTIKVAHKHCFHDLLGM